MLVEAVARAEKGQVDANLGGRRDQAKDRTGKPGKIGAGTGRLSFSAGHRAVFAYRFANNDRANIDADVEKQFMEAARHVLRLTANQIDELLKNGDFVEVKYEE